MQVAGEVRRQEWECSHCLCYHGSVTEVVLIETNPKLGKWNYACPVCGHIGVVTDFDRIHANNRKRNELRNICKVA